MFSSQLVQIVIATALMSVLALVSSIGLSLFPKFLKSATLYLVALAAGTMLATGLFELLPESTHELGLDMSLWIIAGTFTILLGAEKVLHWHHCHDGECEQKPVGYINLIGDGLHNFLDGIVIAAAFQVDPAVGVATTVAVALHELPQEIGDFGVLIHSGFTRSQAVFSNIAVSALAIMGGVLGYWLIQNDWSIAPYLLPVAAGTFLYLAAVDLIPEFRHEENLLKAAVLFTCFVIGLAGVPLASSQLGIGHSHEESVHIDHADAAHSEDHDEHDEDEHDEPASFQIDEL